MSQYFQYSQSLYCYWYFGYFALCFRIFWDIFLDFLFYVIISMLDQFYAFFFYQSLVAVRSLSKLFRVNHPIATVHNNFEIIFV